MTSDTRFCAADNPGGEWKMVLPRHHDVEYDAEPRGDHFFIDIRCAGQGGASKLANAQPCLPVPECCQPSPHDCRLLRWCSLSWSQLESE